MAQAVATVQLSPQTLEAFQRYIGEAEAGMEQTLANGPFLWSSIDSKISAQVGQGHVVAQYWSGDAPVKVPDGLIHDWIGAVLIPGATMAETLAFIQDYDNHKNVYQPDVIDSRLLTRDGDHFQIYLRLLKKKVITVVLDTEHDVQYSCVDPVRWLCRSYTTRISEVDNPRTDHEKILPPDTGYGFLWRMHSYWRFLEQDGGVYLECRAISLTRHVPLALKLIVQPMVKKHSSSPDSFALID
jgi:hypothetical protein